MSYLDSDKIPLTGLQWHTEWQNTALTVNREGIKGDNPINQTTNDNVQI